MSKSCSEPGTEPGGFSFSRFARWTERQVGSPRSFVLALGIVILWAASGPFFGWSDTWQLVINTGTTIVTFLMVFLIQSTQSRDTQALHAKLDELLKAVGDADNDVMDIDEKDAEEVEKERKRVKSPAS